MRVEVSTITVGLRRLSDTNVTRAITLTESQQVLYKVKNSHIRHEWFSSVDSSHLHDLVWINCLDHDGMWGNEQANLLVLRVPVGENQMDKGNIIKTNYGRSYVSR